MIAVLMSCEPTLARRDCVRKTAQTMPCTRLQHRSHSCGYQARGPCRTELQLWDTLAWGPKAAEAQLLPGRKSSQSLPILGVPTCCCRSHLVWGHKQREATAGVNQGQRRRSVHLLVLGHSCIHLVREVGDRRGSAMLGYTASRTFPQKGDVPAPHS